jgi:hypothetical protein
VTREECLERFKAAEIQRRELRNYVDSEKKA